MGRGLFSPSSPAQTLSPQESPSEGLEVEVLWCGPRASSSSDSKGHLSEYIAWMWPCPRLKWKLKCSLGSLLDGVLLGQTHEGTFKVGTGVKG